MCEETGVVVRVYAKYCGFTPIVLFAEVLVPGSDGELAAD